MRKFTLLAFSISALALSACATDGKTADAKRVTTPAASVASASAKTTEQKEMAATMGAIAAPDAVEPATGDDVAAAPVAEEAPKPEKIAGIPSECPGVAVLPDTKSITYFDDPEGKPNGPMTARASLVDIKGGCDYTDTGVVVDLDMIMKGHISSKGRYEGRADMEAFMTFPYFVAVMDPDGKMIDKKIMATAMRFKPSEDDLDHAEKITQTIPLSDVSKGSKYTITVGFQLNRAQLDYNRGSSSSVAKAEPKVEPKVEAPKVEAKVEEKSTPERVEAVMEKPEPVAEVKQPEAEPVAPVSAPAPASEETVAKQVAAPVATKPYGAKMKPIVE